MATDLKDKKLVLRQDGDVSAEFYRWRPFYGWLDGMKIDLLPHQCNKINEMTEHTAYDLPFGYTVTLERL